MMKRDEIASYTEDELEEACKERGLFTELPEDKLRSQLKAWIELPANLQLKALIYHTLRQQDLFITE
jgi:hypothetical protein